MSNEGGSLYGVWKNLQLANPLSRNQALMDPPKKGATPLTHFESRPLMSVGTCKLLAIWVYICLSQKFQTWISSLNTATNKGPPFASEQDEPLVSCDASKFAQQVCPWTFYQTTNPPTHPPTHPPTNEWIPGSHSR